MQVVNLKIKIKYLTIFFMAKVYPYFSIFPSNLDIRGKLKFVVKVV